jgi:hypothetical protein
MALLLKKPVVKRKVFFSFHFANDFWRTQQVRNIGTIEGNSVVSKNAWEEVKKKGDSSIQKWIDDHLEGKSCLIVLIGENTAGRKWIKYEIKQAWDSGKGVVGIRIHNLENEEGKQSKIGGDPFSSFSLCKGKIKLSDIIKIKSPPQTTGKGVYSHISTYLITWIEEAIKIRKDFKCPE